MNRRQPSKRTLDENGSPLIYVAGGRNPFKRAVIGFRSFLKNVVFMWRLIRASQTEIAEPITFSDPGELAWAIERLNAAEPHSVGALVPSGFDRYARIFHPVYKISGFSQSPVLWADVAAYSESQVHPLMQWEKIRTDSIDGADVEWPQVGTLPKEVTLPLRALLSRFTENPSCWFAVWIGWGDDYKPEVPNTCRTIDFGRVHAREYEVFQFPLTLLDYSFFDREQTANMVWPVDNSWWITNDIDLDTTYIGGSATLIEEVLACPHFESFPVEIDDQISIASDVLNAR